MVDEGKKTVLASILFVLLVFVNMIYLVSGDGNFYGTLIAKPFMQSDFGLLNLIGLVLMMGEGASMVFAFIATPYLLKNGFSGFTK